ncbi:hypothetical protein EJ08DRAFT_592666 [Tothia fuscella]|uniref:Uncharacterized protein n=1 Tax=Tothia fuscella TaxID=1048955 RepID=A0A9P4NMI3_9PEZI|nr:hypothetical protein EJ08DRAFT_592666 [Tothia fuscella]
MAPQEHNNQYHPRDAIAFAVESALVTGGAGAFFAGIQNTIARQNIGAMGFFSRFGSTTAVFTAMGASYAFAKAVSANLREKEDTWNTALGGFVGGSMIGLRLRTTPAFFGYGALASILLSTFEYGGGRFSGYKKDPTIDEVDRKTELRKNRRRPIEETVAELGEGRGIYGPGYEARRQERIKARYGIDVSSVPSAH